MIEKLIKIYKNPAELNFKKIWAEGTFIFDTNVLLDLYRLPKSAREDLMSLLENPIFNKQIWTGFEVAVEFLNNRYDVIVEQKNTFTTVRSIIDEASKEYDNIGHKLIVEIGKLNLKKRHSVIDPDSFISAEVLVKSKTFLEEFGRELDELSKMQADVNDIDKIKEFVLRVFNKKIGYSLQKSEIEQICKEGDIRYGSDIPPGYMDKKKPGSYKFQEIEYPCKFGDLILWKEIINFARESKAKYLVLITGDVKDDWWLKKRGKKIGPRPELLNEIYTEAPDLETFHMYDTSNFLRYAKEYLNIQIKDSSIDEAKDLIFISQQRRDINLPGSKYLTMIYAANANQEEINGFLSCWVNAADLRSDLLSFKEIWGQRLSQVSPRLTRHDDADESNFSDTTNNRKTEELRDEVKTAFVAKYVENYFPRLNKLCSSISIVDLSFIHDAVKILKLIPKNPGDVSIIIDTLSILIRRLEDNE